MSRRPFREDDPQIVTLQFAPASDHLYGEGCFERTILDEHYLTSTIRVGIKQTRTKHPGFLKHLVVKVGICGFFYYKCDIGI